MIDGVTEHGVEGRLAPSAPVPANEPVPEMAAPLFDPADVADERNRQLAERAVREGQDRFRLAVLAAYGQVCAITGSDAVTGLEAAHITPFKGPATNVIVNGICLRADIHRLWDGGQIAIDERTQTVVMGSALRNSTYGDLDGQRAKLPRAVNERPSTQALRAHREWCGL
ncbi:HNH endonuclease [Cellulomonas sp. JZ18]|uniref:HNH endonuclease n=1 Tax=Cellulomonas sp. JZ18 TaxID=2654191 RepID=UPI001E3C8A3B|nr:HNH endonuclease [Cellulomonas sp. JZ18]